MAVWIAERICEWVSWGREANMLRVGWRRVSGREGEMDVNASVFASSARKITVLSMRVTACGFGRERELAMPYGMSIHGRSPSHAHCVAANLLLMPKCEAYESVMVAKSIASHNSPKVLVVDL